MKNTHKILIPLSSIILGSTLSNAAVLIYSEDFGADINLYTTAATTGGATATERTGDTSNFAAANFSNSTYIELAKGSSVTSDAIDLSGLGSSYALADISVNFEIAATTNQWDNNDTYYFAVLDGSDNTQLFQLDNLLPGGTNQPLSAYSGAPYAGSTGSLSLGTSPSNLTYSLSDYTGSLPGSIKIQIFSTGSSTNDTSAIGSMAVAVPEPSTYAALFGLFALTAVFVRRQRNR